MLYNIKFDILNEPRGRLVHLRCGFEGERRDYGGERESLERDRGTAPRDNASLPTFAGGFRQWSCKIFFLWLHFCVWGVGIF